MAKKIFFSGPKGGSGKTTLAVHFCNFICYYKKKSVALVGYPIYEINPKNHEEFEATINSLSAVDDVVFDLTSGINLFNYIPSPLC